MDNSIRVEAFDSDWNSVGVFDSPKSAAKNLYIRYYQSIWSYIYGNKGSTLKGVKRGVTSYKTGKKYHFKKV